MDKLCFGQYNTPTDPNCDNCEKNYRYRCQIEKKRLLESSNIKTKVIAIDFDGVINSYSSGIMNGFVILDPPVEGVEFALRQLSRFYKIIIFSARASSPGGIVSIKEYMKKYNIPYDEITNTKPKEVSIFIDDRAIQFKGNWEQTLNDIKNFKIWNKN